MGRFYPDGNFSETWQLFTPLRIWFIYYIKVEFAKPLLMSTLCTGQGRRLYLFFTFLQKSISEIFKLNYFHETLLNYYVFRQTSKKAWDAALLSMKVLHGQFPLYCAKSKFIGFQWRIKLWNLRRPMKPPISAAHLQWNQVPCHREPDQGIEPYWQVSG